MSAPRGSSPSLGSKGDRLLRETLDPEFAPTEADRELELRVFWGDTEIEVQSFAPGRPIFIGSTDEGDIPVYGDEVWEGFELVSAEPGTGETLVRLPPGAEMRVYREGAERAAPREARLALDDRCLVSLGPTSLILRWVRPEPRWKSGFFDATDLPFTKVLTIAFLAQLSVWVGFWITPLTNDLLTEDLFKNPKELLKVRVKPLTVTEAKKPPPGRLQNPAGPPKKPEEHKLGQVEVTRPPKKGEPGVDAKKREHDRSKVLATGLLKGFSEMGSAAEKVLGPGGLNQSINDALGGLQGGGGLGDVRGFGGLGSRGTGPGGGGNLVGIGGLGTKGAGPGGGGYARIDLGGMGKSETRISSGRTVVQGALSKDLIGKIIKRHWGEIKYCYDTELNKNPDLSGKVATSFTIDGTGAVSQADVTETTLNNRNVEDCIISRLRRWTFPEPKGGGEVIVSYPWILTTAGAGSE